MSGEWAQTLARRARRLHVKLELIPIPVSDVDRAKAFYIN